MFSTELNTDYSQNYLLIPVPLIIQETNHKFERPEIQGKSML